MRVLGVDPGSQTLGWGIVEGTVTKYRAVDFGTVKSSPRAAFSKRLLKISDEITSVIEKFQPDVLSVEDMFYANNVKVALKLGQVRGVVLLTGEKNGLEIAEYSPRLVKQTVVGYGNAEKQQVQEMVRILLCLKHKPEPYDAADALAIAICHFHHAGIQDRVKSVKGKR